MSDIRQEIIDNIKANRKQLITGEILQQVLLDMFDRDVFLNKNKYTWLVERGLIDNDKIYHIYEDDS